MNPKSSVEAVCDHIKASYPCSLRGAANWCQRQGLVAYFGDAIAELIKQDEITLDVEETPGYVTINPVVNGHPTYATVDMNERTLTSGYSAAVLKIARNVETAKSTNEVTPKP